MMVAKRFMFGVMSLHLMAGCTGGNGMCKTSIGHGWACPPTWNQWGGSCYKAVMEELTWSQAKDECIKMGGVLVVPQSQEETDFLMQLLPGRFWINCNDIKQEGVWKCQDGNTNVEYRNWANVNAQWPQPDNSGGMEHCAEAYKAGIWNDLGCNLQRHAICKSAIGQHYDCIF